jgi:hypothetical protein
MISFESCTFDLCILHFDVLLHDKGQADAFLEAAGRLTEAIGRLPESEQQSGESAPSSEGPLT